MSNIFSVLAELYMVKLYHSEEAFGEPGTSSLWMFHP